MRNSHITIISDIVIKCLSLERLKCLVKVTRDRVYLKQRRYEEHNYEPPTPEEYRFLRVLIRELKKKEAESVIKQP